MTSKIFIDMAASFWFFLSFLAKSISFYFSNQIFTALGFQKYSHCNKVLYISPWTIPFYTSDVSLLTKKSLIFAVFYTCESGVLQDIAIHHGWQYLYAWLFQEEVTMRPTHVYLIKLLLSVVYDSKLICDLM